MELQSLFSEVIPTMIFAWVFLLISIGFSNLVAKLRKWLRNMAKNASDPSYVKEKVSVSERIEKYKASLAEMKSVKKEKKKKTKTGEEPKVEKTPPAEEKK